MKNEEGYHYDLVIGDYSGDGYDRVERFIIHTNITSEEFQDLYQRMVKTMGITFNHVNDGSRIKVCVDYEDYEVPEQVFERVGWEVPEDKYLSLKQFAT